jgi:hypothetical protein
VSKAPIRVGLGSVSTRCGGIWELGFGTFVGQLGRFRQILLRWRFERKTERKPAQEPDRGDKTDPSRAVPAVTPTSPRPRQKEKKMRPTQVLAPVGIFYRRNSVSAQRKYQDSNAGRQLTRTHS